MLLFSGCMTYFELNEDLIRSVYLGDYNQADQFLEQSKSKLRKRDKLLYLLNKGSVAWMKKDYVQSNDFFRQADYYIEDNNKDVGDVVFSLLVNSSLEKYTGEGFEQILLHYYSTLNYLGMGKFEDALIECKRMQQKLQKFTDYCGGKNKYKTDAFAHLLLGIVYDAMKDPNNAFIAYRNAYEIYKSDYSSGLKTECPRQLKLDLTRTAFQTGFIEEAKNYEKEFGIISDLKNDTNTGQLVAFWNSGLGPIKDEWSVTFSIVPGANNTLYFENNDLNMRFSFPSTNEKERENLTKLKIIRVAFPKYVSRVPVFTNATLSADSAIAMNSGEFEIAEPVNNIAFQALRDRMFKEMSMALLRLAIKQSEELLAEKKDKTLGSAVSILNALTEQADTRNWQLLPYSIQYTRMSLPEGEYNFRLKLKGPVDKAEVPLHSEIKRNGTSFLYYQDNKFSGFAE